MPIKGTIRRHKWVREAVVFGIGRAIPGLLVFRSQAAKNLDSKHFIKQIWPTVDASRCLAEGFSQIGTNTLVPMPAGGFVPFTSERSIIRTQVYNVFAKRIDEAYLRLEQRHEGVMVMDSTEFEDKDDGDVDDGGGMVEQLNKSCRIGKRWRWRRYNYGFIPQRMKEY